MNHESGINSADEWHAAFHCLNALLEICCCRSTNGMFQPCGIYLRLTVPIRYQFLHGLKTQLLHIFADGSCERDVADISKDLLFFHNFLAICSLSSIKVFEAQHTIQGRISTAFYVLGLKKKSQKLICIYFVNNSMSKSEQ